MSRAHRTRTFALLVLLGCAIGAARLPAADWPSYRGEDGAGRSAETNLLTTWSLGAPEVLWRIDIGRGYSGIAVRNGLVFTQFGRGGEEIAAAFDAETGREVWRAITGKDRPDGQGGGPRSTPTVEDGLVFVVGASGGLHAFKAADGARVWSRNLVADFGARVPQWGVSASPVVTGDLLLIEAGGRTDHALLALDKKTGAVRWHVRGDKPGYSTPIVARIAGREQAVFFTADALVATTPADGSVLWEYTWKTSYGVNAAMPVFVPPDKVFISTGYGKGAALLRVSSTGAELGVEELWRSKIMQNHFNSSVLVNGYLYGFDNATLKCIEAASGQEAWAKRSFGKGSLLYADGHLLVLSERGVLLSVEATPEEYRETGRAQILKGKTWTMPSLANGRLFLRDEREMVAVSLNP
ncbi:MAG: PQQ-binding-like beta-propeller repeat protein [bacterium]|nr:PQQ-binding-like beta-propeller repeat protein [bacterium]